MDETILITGGCGFVGSNLAVYLKTKHPTAKVIAFDNLKRRGSELNIKRLSERGVIFLHGDIRNKEDFDGVGEISTLIEAAAEPSVLSGIDSTPDYVLNVNLQGAINCLLFAKKHSAKFIFLSTSRVYPISALNKLKFNETSSRFDLQETQTQVGVSKHGISEEFTLGGARSFYGTSKLSVEYLVEEYAEFYKLKTIINRFGVITGPWQMGKVDQGVVVLWLAKHFWKKQLSYIGYGGAGKQVRDILHVEDLCSLIEMQLFDFNRYLNLTFNVGGGLPISVSLQELTDFCQEITGNKIRIDSNPENRPGDIPIYLTDSRKLFGISNWRPQNDVRTILLHTFDWMKANEKDLKSILM